MRPVRIISCAVAVAATVAIAGCTTNAALQPSPAVAPAEAAPATPVRPTANGAPRTLPSPSATPIATSPRQTLTPAPTPTPPTAPRWPHFATPQASMRYLAAAYNHNDLVALKHVTTPQARTALQAMRANAPNLQLVGCSANAGRGDYTCAFTHDFTVASNRSGHGHAHFTVAPADRPGWYMTVLEDCD
jgi:hypothetical protein